MSDAPEVTFNERRRAAYRRGDGKCRHCGAAINIATGHLHMRPDVCDPLMRRDCHEMEMATDA